MRIKRILEVGTGAYHTPPTGYGGTERIIANLAMGLKEIGIDTSILDYTTSNSPVDHDRLLLKVPFHFNPRYNALLGNVDALIFGLCLFLSSVNKRLTLAPYDVIHCHKFLLSFFALLATHRHKSYARPIIVYSNHDPNLACVRTLSLPKRIVLSLTLVCAAKLVDYITFETRSSLENAPELTETIPHFVLQNPIDVSLYSGPRLGEVPNVLYVAKISRVKGQVELIKAFAKLNSMVPGVTLTLVGGPVEISYLDDMQKEIAINGLQHAVKWSPALSKEVLLRLYKTSAVNISLSATAGTDLSVREGLAAGAATIAPEITPVKEFLRNGVDALLVDPTDIADISQAMLRLLHDAELRARVQTNGNRIVKEKIDKSSVARKLVDELLASRLS